MRLSCRVVAAALALTAALAAGCSTSDRLGQNAPPTDPPVPANAFAATVERVVDGDTFLASRSGVVRRVRLIGIDAPESVKPDAPVDCFGPESSRALKRLLPRGTKVMAAYQGAQRQDRFGRDLWDVWLGGRFLQAELVRSGFAEAHEYPPQKQYSDLLEALSEDAKDSGAGLFGACREAG